MLHWRGRVLAKAVAHAFRSLFMQVLQEMVARHQAARAAVTEEQVDAFMAVRPMTDLFG